MGILVVKLNVSSILLEAKAGNSILSCMRNSTADRSSDPFPPFSYTETTLEILDLFLSSPVQEKHEHT